MRFERVRTALRSLRFRLTGWNTVVVLLTVIASLLAVNVGMYFTLLRETDQYLIEDTLEVGLAVREFYPDMQQVQEEMTRKAVGHSHRDLFVQLLDPDGQVAWSSVHTPERIQTLPRPDANPLATIDGFRVAHRVVEAPGVPRFIVRVGTSLSLVQQDVARLTQMIFIVGGIMLIVSPLGGYWLAGRVTRPLGAMSELATKLRPGNLAERLPISETGDELDSLSLTVNGLLDRIAAYLNQNRQFIANAAHELRSPLAAIQSSVEVALNVERSEAEYQELLGEIVEQCSDLRTLVNQLLLLAESDVGVALAGACLVEIDDVVARSVEMFRGAAEEQGVQLHLKQRDAAKVMGHANRLRQVVNNLIDNAIKFNHAGGEVVVSVEQRTRGEAAISISDTGQGIAAEDLPHVFERFYRGDKSRQREHAASGNGLGLSICQAIVNSYGGTIDVQSRVGHGTLMTVHLPCFDESLPTLDGPLANLPIASGPPRESVG